MRLNNQILSNLRENKEDWYYLCNDAEQALFKVKNECKDERAIKSIERMILELNNIRMEQYNALTEYALVEEDIDIYSNVDEADMVNNLRNHFKGIKNKDYIDKSLRFHHKEGFINDDEYRQLKGEYLGNLTVKEYEDLPYSDFKADNTIGILNDGTPFLVTDDNVVYTIDEKVSLNELKTMLYDGDESKEGYLNKYMEEHSKALDDDKLTTLILVDIGRLSDEVLDESFSGDMTTATIYQIRDIANTDYAFRGYDEVADKVNLDDYDKVATIDISNNDDALELIFMYGNTDKSKFNEIKPMRSISVSDIIELDGTKYYVDSFGFKEL